MKPWRAQKFFGDVVYDLRNKGLLPAVILLVIAMVAVPVLISRGGSSSSNSLQPTAGTTPTQAPEIEHAVVSYSPGIRDYKRRLNDLSAKNPFQQQFQQSAAKASALTSTASTPSSTGTDTSSSTSSSTPTSTGTTGDSGGTDGGSTTKKKKKASVSYQVNVLAGEVNSTLTPFNDVAAMTPLPSQNAPVVLYYGLTSDHKKAQFLVSNKVASVNGPGTCVPSPDDCALLTLPAGQAEDVVYNGDGKIYRIVVAAIKSVKK